MTTDDMLTIGPVPADRTVEALRVLFRNFDTEQRDGYVGIYVRALEAGTLDRAALLGAFRGDRLVGAAWALPQPGRTALAWPARTTDDEPSTTALQLMEAGNAYLAGRRVRISNALLEKVNRADDALLRSGGYQPLATLYYMAALEADFPGEWVASPVEFEVYTPDQRARLAGVLQATYENSLDCPALDGVRSIDESLDSYQGTGAFSPDRWFFVRQGGRDVGCLLLADHPADDQWELVYMGLIPESRGKGWGVWVARYAQWRTRQAGRPRIVVAVDASNTPAVAMYSHAGYFVWQQRSVYLRVFPETP